MNYMYISFLKLILGENQGVYGFGKKSMDLYSAGNSFRDWRKPLIKMSSGLRHFLPFSD